MHASALPKAVRRCMHACKSWFHGFASVRGTQNRHTAPVHAPRTNPSNLTCAFSRVHDGVWKCLSRSLAAFHEHHRRPAPHMAASKQSTSPEGSATRNMLSRSYKQASMYDMNNRFSLSLEKRRMLLQKSKSSSSPDAHKFGSGSFSPFVLFLRICF